MKERWTSKSVQALVHCALCCMAFGSMRCSMWLNAVCTCSKPQCRCLVSHALQCTYHFTPTIVYFLTLLHACVHRWWSVVSLFLLFNAGRIQCLSLVCWGWPSCCCSIPYPQNGGPPLWVWWWWKHSFGLCSPRRPVVHGGVPREILWIWCESKG